MRIGSAPPSPCISRSSTVASAGGRSPAARIWRYNWRAACGGRSPRSGTPAPAMAASMPFNWISSMAFSENGVGIDDRLCLAEKKVPQRWQQHQGTEHIPEEHEGEEDAH